MQLTQEDLEEFKQIYRREYGADISDAQALEMGTRLLRVVKVVVDVCGQEHPPALSPTAVLPAGE
jgi:hypothetical protein